jgi:chromosome segregation ATPase
MTHSANEIGHLRAQQDHLRESIAANDARIVELAAQQDAAQETMQEIAREKAIMLGLASFTEATLEALNTGTAERPEILRNWLAAVQEHRDSLGAGRNDLDEIIAAVRAELSRLTSNEIRGNLQSHTAG